MPPEKNNVAGNEAGSVTLDALDAILDSYPTMADFLREDRAVDRYYLAAAEFHGEDRFPRAAFNELLAQLRVVLQKLPDLDRRLWTKSATHGPDIQIESALKSSGRYVRERDWTRMVARWTTRLRVQAAEFFELSSDAEREALLRSIEAKYDAQVAAFEAAQRQHDLGPSSRQRSRFFDTLKANPELKAAAAYVLRRHLTSPAFQPIVDSDDADLILHTLETLRARPKQVLTYPVLPSPFVLGHLKRLVPSVDWLIRHRDLFPQRVRTARSGKLVPVDAASRVSYRFQKLPRPFHGVFKGLSIGECIGGSIQCLESSTPERWSTAAVEDVELYAISRFSGANGRYVGFVQVFPVYDRHGRCFASLDFGANAFRQPVGGPAVSLFERWLGTYARETGARWAGFLVSESNALNNAGALDAIRLTLPYVLGKGHWPRHFHCRDPWAKRVVGLLPRKGFAKQYGGRLIFDAGTKDARTVTELALHVHASSEERIGEQLRALLHSRDPVRRWRAAIVMLRQRLPDALAVRVLTRGLAATHRPRLWRWACVLTGWQPENKFTMELWSESVRLLERHLTLAASRGTLPGSLSLDRVRRRLAALAEHGRNGSIRELARQACQQSLTS